MRFNHIGSPGSRARQPSLFLEQRRRSPTPWLRTGLFALLGTLGTAAGLQAQAQPASATAAAAPATSAEAAPLARYVPRDDLILYVEFDGLDAHADAWKQTAAYKMLTNTPLGVMLEEVAAQLLERPLAGMPNRKLTGAEMVTLIKAASRKGWVLSIRTGKDAKAPVLGTLVLRGLAAKDQRALSGRLMGMLMGANKPRIERRGERPLIMLSNEAGQPAGVWWTEKDDLVMGLTGLPDADAVIAALDGKTPSVANHAVLNQLNKAEGGFVPVMTALLDPAAIPAQAGAGLTGFVGKLKAAGLNRIDFRWGFDDDALQSETRLVAPSPRKSLLAIFDQSKLDTKHLIPIPEDVDSFVVMSAAPAKVLEAALQLGLPGVDRTKIDEFLAGLKERNRIDFEKDFLGHLGPKMAFYLAPGRSAATEETPEPPPTTGAFDLSALLSSLGSSLPKPTLVAELQDPKAFGKALDAVMIAVNKELKAKAIEKAAEETAAEEAGARQPGFQGPGQLPGAGRPAGVGGGARTGDRPARKKSSRETPAPEFRLMPGSASSKSYRLTVPSDSALKLGGPGVHPTIRIEDKYVAFSSSSDAARLAIDMLKKKEWKPPADIEKAVSRVPDGAALLAVVDSRETTPGLLASLPGTLQAQINSAIAMADAKAAGGQAGAGPGMGRGPGGMPVPPGPGGMSMARGGPPAGRMAALGGPGASSGSSGPPPGYAKMMAGPGGGSSGMQPPGGPGGAGSPGGGMIELKVDPSKLPKAEELKALMFPATLAVLVDDQAIKIVSREAFPTFVIGLGGGPAASALLAPAIQAVRAKTAPAAGAEAPGAAASAPGQPRVGPGGPPGASSGGMAPGRPPAPGGRGAPRGPRRGDGS